MSDVKHAPGTALLGENAPAWLCITAAGFSTATLSQLDYQPKKHKKPPKEDDETGQGGLGDQAVPLEAAP